MPDKFILAIAFILSAASFAFAGENASETAPPGGPGRAVIVDDAAPKLENWITIAKFEAVIRADEYMQALVVSGESKNLPDGCIVTLEVLFEGNSIAATRKMIAANRFEWKYEIEGGKKFFSGKYQATAQFNPNQRQDPELIGRIEREQGLQYGTYKHNASKELVLGTETKRLAEINECKTDSKRYMAALFKHYGDIQTQGDAFKPKEKETANKADFKNREKAWRSFQEKLERDAANIKSQFTDADTGKYANYLVMRFPDSAANIVAICDALLKGAAVASVQGYKAWGEQSPKDDEETAQGIQRASPIYIEKYLFEPALRELGMDKKDIGWIEAPPPAPPVKEEKAGSAEKKDAAPAKGEAPKDKKEKSGKDKK